MTYPLPISLIISADDLGVSKARNQGMASYEQIVELINSYIFASVLAFFYFTF